MPYSRAVSFALALILTAAPVKLAAPGFTCANVDPAVCEAMLERFVGVLA